MVDAIAEYLEARKAAVDAEARVKRLTNIVKAVGDALSRDPGHFMFSNASGMPAEVSLSGRSVSVSANDWPSAEDIQSALRDWHEARATARDAWGHIPDQAGLEPPPD